MAKDGTKWDEKASPGENARSRIPKLVAAYYLEGRQAAEGQAPPEALHAFRLHTKKLRYTVELFRSCYGPGLQRWLAALSRIQDHLGAISDCATAARVCFAHLPEAAPERERLAAYLDRRIAREAASFRRYWRSEFDRPAESRRWEAYFRRKSR